MFVLGRAWVSGKGVERDHGFAAVELGLIIGIVVGIDAHGRDAMAEVRLVRRGSPRDARLVRVVGRIGLSARFIMICHVAHTSALSRERVCVRSVQNSQNYRRAKGLPGSVVARPGRLGEQMDRCPGS